MKIKFVELQNFRKLKHCKIDFADKETVFVGANNSGKTSAMDALILFLKERTKFSTRDFTLSNWKDIINIGSLWLKETDTGKLDFSIQSWEKHLPQIDIWIEVLPSEIHYVNDLIPTLDWSDGLLGVRLRLEPKDIETLYKDFYTTSTASKEAKTKAKKSKLKLWPTSLWDFLDRKFHAHFTINSYILDPSKLTDGSLQPQELPLGSLPLIGDVFKGLIKIDVINAQRGFTDANADNGAYKAIGNLSVQFREYYEKHLDPSVQPEATDIDALEAIDLAQTSFDARLKSSFKDSLEELEELNYPGFGNPTITISSKINAMDGISHPSAVQFNVLKNDPLLVDYPLSLPEKSNGLGYQNLISMVFKLIRFRDEWMQIGKSSKHSSVEDSIEFEPLHLVLVEEPEAHLHAQIQQVFIRKAYEILRKNAQLRDKTQFTTQLIVSTHSSHIAHEIDFTSLRYFKRNNPIKGLVPTSCVVNLSKTFGGGSATTKFAIRYLKTTHCDLFFADAAILVEGPAERMLIPHFIKHHSPKLASCYISILEIGGSHAHTLKPLIEDLGLITLLITDIDSTDDKGNKAQPVKGKKFKTGNDTIKKWIPANEDLDTLLSLAAVNKVSATSLIRVAYQTPLNIAFAEKETDKTLQEALPYTFEDSLVLENLHVFRKLSGTGLMKKMVDAAKKTKAADATKDMFEALYNGKKAEFALELLFLEDPEKLKTPNYINEGFEWLKEKLEGQKDIILTDQKAN